MLGPGGLLFVAELDRLKAADKEEIRRMVGRTGNPACFRGIATRFFRDYIGSSLAADAVSDPLEELQMTDITVEDAASMPAFAVVSRKPDAGKAPRSRSGAGARTTQSNVTR